jgi:FKBP-type peptidyl-prolyl cis-trans isomerase (trigger factor)
MAEKGRMTMIQSTLTVGNDMVVSLDYVLQLDSGEEIDRSEDGEPLYYLHGHDQIVAGLERELEGMIAGSEKDIVVTPADGYGEHDPDKIQTFPGGVGLQPPAGRRNAALPRAGCRCTPRDGGRAGAWPRP